METELWGPHLWFFMHTLTFNYPENPTEIEKSRHYQFLLNLSYVLPCEICRDHYKEYFNEYPPDLLSRYSFIRWMLDLHNSVNVRNGKDIWTYEQFLDHYYGVFKLGKKKKSNSTQIFIILGVVFLIFLLILFYFKRKDLFT